MEVLISNNVARASDVGVRVYGFGRPVQERPVVKYSLSFSESEFIKLSDKLYSEFMRETIEEYSCGSLDESYLWIVQDASSGDNDLIDHRIRIIFEFLMLEFLCFAICADEDTWKAYVVSNVHSVCRSSSGVVVEGVAFLAKPL